MASFADATHALERVAVSTINGAGQKIYYRSQAFWRTSAAVNLPSMVNQTNYSGLNGFDSRCCAYGRALNILTEMRFPDATGETTLLRPE